MISVDHIDCTGVTVFELGSLSSGLGSGKSGVVHSAIGVVSGSGRGNSWGSFKGFGGGPKGIVGGNGARPNGCHTQQSFAWLEAAGAGLEPIFLATLANLLFGGCLGKLRCHPVGELHAVSFAWLEAAHSRNDGMAIPDAMAQPRRARDVALL